MQHAILGWYVGVLELKDSVYAFACNISAKSEASGMKARDITRRILVERVIEPNGHVIAAPGGD